MADFTKAMLDLSNAFNQMATSITFAVSDRRFERELTVWQEREMPALGWRVWHVSPREDQPEQVGGPGRIITRVRMTGGFSQAMKDAHNFDKQEIVPLYKLDSIGMTNHFWTPESMQKRATCVNYPALFNEDGDLVTGHSAPDPACQCGYYAVHTLRYLNDTWSQATLKVTDSDVVAAVCGWGKVVQHGEYGFRSEWLKIIGFLDRASLPEDLRVYQSNKPDRITEIVAEQFGLPMMSLSGLQLAMREYGSFLPHMITDWSVTCALCGYKDEERVKVGQHCANSHGIAVDSEAVDRLVGVSLGEGVTSYTWFIAGTKIAIMTAIKTVTEVNL